MADIKAFVPYGKLPSGKIAAGYDNHGVPNVAAIEVLPALPAVEDQYNFTGRCVYSTVNALLYVFETSPERHWRPIDGVPVQVGPGEPSPTPVPLIGSLYYSTNLLVLYVWDGSAWKPIAGQYASQIIHRRYIADGTTTMYATGCKDVLSPEYIVVSLDGVDQTPVNDYSSIGTNIVFTSAPPAGVVINMRSFPSMMMMQNAEMYRTTYMGDGLATDFFVGTQAVDPNGVFVFVNGELAVPTDDYTFIAADTRISSLTHTAGVATANTFDAHGLATGYTVTIRGATEAQYNNQSFIITSTPSPTQFTFNVVATTPRTATANPIMYFTPAYSNDKVRFITAPTAGQRIEIRCLKNAVIAPQAGEANTVSSVGAGHSLFYAKVGDDLQFKSISSGANVNIQDLGTELRVNVNSVQAYENRIAITQNIYTVEDTVSNKPSYIGVRSTAQEVTINLNGIAVSPSNNGRRLTIMDESGGAAYHNIVVQTGSVNVHINGTNTPYVINTNYGSATLVMDGAHWFVVR